MLTIVIAILAVIASLLVVAKLFKKHVKISETNKDKKLPPVVPALLPYLGSAVSFGLRPLQHHEDCYKKYGDIYTLEVMGQRTTFLTGPAASGMFFKGDDTELTQDEPYRFCVPIFGPGVVYDVPLEIRSQQLRILGRSLRTDCLRSYVGQINKECEDYFGKWPNEIEVDVRDVFAELIILTASRSLMGDEIRSRLHSRVAKIFQDLDEGLTSLSIMFPYAPIPAHRRRDRARLEMVRIFSEIMKERIEQPDVKHEDALSVFMEAKYRDGKTTTAEEVAGLMIALLFAGQHTSSITTSWTGLRMARDPKLIERVVAEQKQVLAKYNGAITLDSLTEMDLLHRCIKEALRMNPPLIFLMRKTEVEFTYKDYVVPKGDILFVSPTLNHRMPDVFKNPDTYNPDRFVGEDAEDKKTQFGYVGFGAGRHECMGQQFAYMQVKTIWTILLRDFEISAEGPIPEPDYTAMVVGPSHPAMMKFKRRVPK